MQQLPPEYQKQLMDLLHQAMQGLIIQQQQNELAQKQMQKAQAQQAKAGVMM
jgi:hypothetical protein